MAIDDDMTVREGAKHRERCIEGRTVVVRGAVCGREPAAGRREVFEQGLIRPHTESSEDGAEESELVPGSGMGSVDVASSSAPAGRVSLSPGGTFACPRMMSAHLVSSPSAR
jgi:hypothetical protein